MTLDKIIITARKHVDAGEYRSSALLLLGDAIALRDAGDFVNAKSRALKSLEYSVGRWHPDYKQAAKE